jgi:hypothetical protein
MRVRPEELSDQERAEAVRAFDALYGEMEKVLWCLSIHSRAALLDRDGESPVLEALIWTIKKWWGLQGVRHETRSAMAKALAALEWSPELFEPVETPPPGGEGDAVKRVVTLVEGSRAMGAHRREYSLASKVLHWLLPWRIPVYDSFVRSSVGVSERDDLGETYGLVAGELFRAARNVTATDHSWMGELEPRAVFRALDKCFWWVGGGNAGNALVARDPWRTIDELGLKCS